MQINMILYISILFYIDHTFGLVQVVPNVLLLLTDDQDVELHGLHPLQKTTQFLTEYGTKFTNAYTSTPLCCPARASLLTGQYAHNHLTFNNSINGGCNGHHWRTISEPRTLPVLLQKHGYHTFFAGKYLNQFKGAKVPPGWDQFYGLHGNSRYYNYTIRENRRNVSYADTYLTDMLRDRTVKFIHNVIKGQKPFFAMITPPAAHAPFTPAPRHEGVFSHVRALRTPSFNAPSKDKHWLVRTAKHLPNSTVLTVDKYFQKRWETLLAVDEMMVTIVTLLKKYQCLDNTYIIYTSDNGYHLGQFAQPFDKRQPYQTDIKVPLLIRGPDVPGNILLNFAVSLVDLMPTILEWVGLTVPNYVDGRSFKDELLQQHQTKRHSHRILLVEYWGEGNDETYNSECPEKQTDHLAECTLDADCHCQDAWNNTYTCIRDFRYKLDRIYCEFYDTEHFIEAYDLIQDPYQLKNIAYELLPSERTEYGFLIANLTICAGKSCHINY
ncbi:N-acetylglucosamine-6-sulfatase-like isoform X1 [Drosophila navojoa]|uniref:N-acetylglucosamine-6-sulfatase-like isoform X1 n=1 Tax=Drosophila navojoa TaxID=7232 RepID=UPI00084711E9|nr:N-acetylglucosamine-6-sulfatase-like isoform X1 [Drosophila navojoa]